MINSKLLKKDIKEGKIDARLLDVYLDESMISLERGRYIKAIEKFEENFGESEIAIFSAPGRSEVCGNHTDHQHGPALATSINLDTIAVASYNDTDMVNFISEGFDCVSIPVSDIAKLEVNEKEFGACSALIKGVLKGFHDKGYTIKGFNAYSVCSVIVGAGLSSSASFEVAIGTVISGLFNNGAVDSVEVAKIAQFSEYVYFGKPCGLLDQTACSVGGMISMDFFDPKNPIVNKTESDFDKFGYSICITDTKGSHSDLTDEYAMIPKEMKKVAQFFGKEFLRDCSEDEFTKNIAEIRKVAGDRAVLRAGHFFNEQKNVKNAVDGLNKSDFEKFLFAIKKSGLSSFRFLQNVYSVKDVQKQSVSVALAVSEDLLKDGAYGVCRVHGGGFAGTIQAFVKNDYVNEYKKGMESVFGENSCHVLRVRKYGGIQVI